MYVRFGQAIRRYFGEILPELLQIQTAVNKVIGDRTVNQCSDQKAYDKDCLKSDGTAVVGEVPEELAQFRDEVTALQQDGADSVFKDLKTDKSENASDQAVAGPLTADGDGRIDSHNKESESDGDQDQEHGQIWQISAKTIHDNPDHSHQFIVGGDFPNEEHGEDHHG